MTNFQFVCSVRICPLKLLKAELAQIRFLRPQRPPTLNNNNQLTQMITCSANLCFLTIGEPKSHQYNLTGYGLLFKTKGWYQ